MPKGITRGVSSATLSGGQRRRAERDAKGQHAIHCDDALMFWISISRQVSSGRVLNENTIGFIKRFHIVSDRYRKRRKRFGLRLTSSQASLTLNSLFNVSQEVYFKIRF